ncbi:interleukin-21 receptor [Myripristis murdjan]|uniref:interleukin-21 receptor n=1 Tax=Myripristis murdjan TaxID=586833 RepID=UPI00117642E2|nr:interleukin-21 receptor-like [Myripristis murdjan]
MCCRLMDSPLRLKLMVLAAFLLASTSSVYVHGNSTATDVKIDLNCVTDFMLVINCSLNMTPPDNDPDIISSWLAFHLEEYEDPIQKYVCVLSKMKDGFYICSFDKSHQKSDSGGYFGYMDYFDIGLCHNKSNVSESCEVILREFQPRKNIKPNAPCCLTANQLPSDDYQFTWKDGNMNPYLKNKLTYEFQYYITTRRDEVKTFTEMRNNVTKDSDDFLPGTEYAFRVRSQPESDACARCWSDWSPEANWMTARKDPLFLGVDKKVFIPLCLVVPLLLLVFYVPIKKCKQGAFIPTPAPYFHSLYSDCKGDFKSWVVTPNTTNMLKAEETIQIDTMTKCEDEPEEDRPAQFHHQLKEEGAYGNLSAPAPDASLLAIPYTVSPGPPLSASGNPLKDGSTVSGLGSTVGDSGCWLCSDTSLDRDIPWYSNQYCTLSAFQQSGSVVAQHHSAGGSLGKGTSILDYQNSCHQEYFGTSDIEN